MATRQLKIEILGDAKSAQNALGDAGKAAGGLNVSVGKVAGAFAGLAAGGAAISFLGDSVAGANESAQAQAALTNALKNNAATAGLTADAFGDYNAALAKKALADDDAISSGQAVLAGFNLTEAQIKQLSPVLLDYAAKTGKDLPTAAQDLGKAMLGQGKSLKAIGIEFQDAGDPAANFAQVMDQVGGKTKGAAQAQLDAAGPGAKMQKSMDELQESIGTLLLPALGKLSEIGVKIVDFFTGMPGPAKILVGLVGALAAGVVILNVAQNAWASASAAVTAAQGALNAVMAANPIGLVVIAIVGLVAAFVVAWKNCETFRDIVKGAFNIVLGVVSGVFNWVKDNWPLLLAILTGPIGIAVKLIVDHWDTIKNAFTAVKDWIFDRIGDIVGFFTALPGRLAGAAGDVFRFVRDLIDGAKQWVSDRIGDVVGFFVGIGGRIAGAAGDVFRFVRDLIDGAKQWVWDRITDIVTGWLNIGSRIAGAAGDLFRIVRDKVSEAKDWVGGRIGDIVGFFTGIGGRIAGVASGMFDGIKEAFKAAVNFIIRGWNNIDFKIPGFKIGPIGYDGFTLGLPDIPLLAKGGDITRGGLAVVGDAGPEILDLPAGARVTPLTPGSRGGGGTVNITVNVSGSVVSERQLVDAVHAGLLKKKGRGSGLGF